MLCGARLKGVSHWLCLFTLWLCRWPLILEAFFNGVKDLILDVLLHCLFTSASPVQPQELICVPVQIFISWHIELGPNSSMTVDSAPGLILAMAPSGLSGWHGCVYFGLLLWCVKTPVTRGIHSEGCRVAITSAPRGKHWYPTANLPPLLKHFQFSPASWQWQFLLFGWHPGY